MRKAKRILVGLKTLDNAVELTDLACRLGARGASVQDLTRSASNPDQSDPLGGQDKRAPRGAPSCSATPNLGCWAWRGHYRDTVRVP
jgi:hypothetical protein